MRKQPQTTAGSRPKTDMLIRVSQRHDPNSEISLIKLHKMQEHFQRRGGIVSSTKISNKHCTALCESYFARLNMQTMTKLVSKLQKLSRLVYQLSLLLMRVHYFPFLPRTNPWPMHSCSRIVTSGVRVIKSHNDGLVDRTRNVEKLNRTVSAPERYLRY